MITTPPLPVTDPRHPLQMDLSAAENHVRNWQRISSSIFDDDRKELWAKANLAFHQGRVETLKQRIAAAQKGARA